MIVSDLRVEMRQLQAKVVSTHHSVVRLMGHKDLDEHLRQRLEWADEALAEAEHAINLGLHEMSAAQNFEED